MAYNFEDDVSKNAQNNRLRLISNGGTLATNSEAVLGIEGIDAKSQALMEYIDRARDIGHTLVESDLCKLMEVNIRDVKDLDAAMQGDIRGGGGMSPAVKVTPLVPKGGSGYEPLIAA